jgi:hypothetical protein
MSAVDNRRAEALFCSPLQPSDGGGALDVRVLVTAALARLGEAGCAAQVAQEFGDHPELAARRMGWCRTAVEAAFTPTLTGASR